MLQYRLCYNTFCLMLISVTGVVTITQNVFCYTVKYVSNFLIQLGL
jgi:hypothetical protein